MARARNIKPGFFSNDELVELPFATRLLFIGLWTLSDRAGRMEDRPKKIKMALFPADDMDVDGALDELQSSGFIHRYEVACVRYIQVLEFAKHQNPHKDEKVSTIPAPFQHSANIVQEPINDDANRADSLIPDSLIPDSGFPLEPPSGKPKRKPDATATRLPADWLPTDGDKEFCKAERPDLALDAVAARFRDYWHSVPGAKGRKLDWNGTWRNWVRSERRANSGPPDRFDPVAAVNRNRNPS